MTKYVLDNMIFNHLLECTPEQLNKIGTLWDFYVVSHTKNLELRDFILLCENEEAFMLRFPNIKERMNEIFTTLEIKTLPNHHFPFIEDNPWWPWMYPLSDNTNPVFTDIWWPSKEPGTINDALIADATSLAGCILITNDWPLTRKWKKRNIPVLNWDRFFSKI